MMPMPKLPSLLAMRDSVIVVILGGSTDSREQGALSQCELLSICTGGIDKNVNIISAHSNSAIPPHHHSQKQQQQQLLLPNLQCSRRAPAFFHFPNCGHIFVLGGCTGPGQHLNSAEMYNLSNVAQSLASASPQYCWQLVNSNNNGNMKQAAAKTATTTQFSSAFGNQMVHGFSCAAFCQLENGQGYVFGGFDGNECISQVLHVNAAEPHRIIALQPLPFGLKNAAAVAAMEPEKCWIVGGWDGRRTLSTIMQYDCHSQQCKIRHLLPYPLEGHAIAKANNTITNSSTTASADGVAFIVGGFDGINVCGRILLMDTRNGQVLGATGVELQTARENCAALCFCTNYSTQHGDCLVSSCKEWLAVFGGWNGHEALADCELFEVLPSPPWLRKAEWTEIGGIDNFEEGEFGMKLRMPRNRPAAALCQL